MSTGSGVLRHTFAWHRPSMTLAAGSLGLLVVCLVGYATDPRRLFGVSIWNKPTLFAISVAVYAVTMAWLVSVLPRRRRAASRLGTVSAVVLAAELAGILLQVVRGRASHFNHATPFDTAVFDAMGGLIATLWLCDVVVVVLLLRVRLADRALTWALRLGMLIALVGMALAVLMTLPTPAQRAAADAGRPVPLVGAHAVGVPDGGPGLPVVGWSTVGGDLRIPHFVGLHGLQAMILLAVVLRVLARRVPALAAETTRVRLVLVGAAGYLGGLAVVTWQALRGQSIVHPDAWTLLASAGVAVAVVVGGGLVLALRPARATRSSRRQRPPASRSRAASATTRSCTAAIPAVVARGSSTGRPASTSSR